MYQKTLKNAIFHSILFHHIPFKPHTYAVYFFLPRKIPENYQENKRKAPKQQPPSDKGRRLKIYYGTQAGYVPLISSKRINRINTWKYSVYAVSLCFQTLQKAIQNGTKMR